MRILALAACAVLMGCGNGLIERPTAHWKVTPNYGGSSDIFLIRDSDISIACLSLLGCQAGAQLQSTQLGDPGINYNVCEDKDHPKWDTDCAPPQTITMAPPNMVTEPVITCASAGDKKRWWLVKDCPAVDGHTLTKIINRLLEQTDSWEHCGDFGPWIMDREGEIMGRFRNPPCPQKKKP